MRIKAHVPTQQYGFIEISGDPEDKAEIERLYNEYAESPIAFKQGNTKRLQAFVGGEIDYDELNHVYSWKGEKYLSGSEYAKSKQKPFEVDMISELMAKNVDFSAADIKEMWKLKSQISTNFGNAVHGALELHGRYIKLSNALDAHRATKAQEAKNTHLHDHPILQKVVQSFYEGRENENAEYEVLIVDHKAKRAGRIDRLLITAPKTCIIQDYKTNVKEDPEYWKDQLGFYEGILVAGGWAVLSKEIQQYNGEWKEIKV